jgi:hypothetical protein
MEEISELAKALSGELDVGEITYKEALYKMMEVVVDEIARIEYKEELPNREPV